MGGDDEKVWQEKVPSIVIWRPTMTVGTGVDGSSGWLADETTNRGAVED